MGETSNANLLTMGSIPKKIIMFAIPLLWGNLFQQLYNVADSLIVGNFLGNNALAAVSSSGNLIFLMVGFFGGIGVGAGVVIARYFGAGEYEKLKKAIHTALAFGGVCGIFLTVAALILAPQILKLIGTPEEVLPKSLVYFRVYFAGSLGFVIYNFGMGILQSLGDSKSPVIYLIISACLNVILDLVLIGGLGFGVGAAAFATIVSQILSAALCIRKLRREPEAFRLSFRELRMDGKMLRLIVVNGIPAGIQNSIIAVANVFVQSNINQFGALAMAGCGSYSKIEGFGFIPVTCFSQALTTFIGQNLGAKEYDRAKKGAAFGIVCSMTLAELVGVIVYMLIPYLAAAFDSSAEVVGFATRQAHVEALFYCFLAFSHCIAGIMRGAGKSAVSMFVMLVSWCIIRITYITITVHFIPKIQVIFWAYPLTWSISSIIFLVYFLKADWIHNFERAEQR